jgi:hypothetical protein
MSTHDCWHFLSALDVIVTVALVTFLLVKQVRDLPLLWDQLENMLSKIHYGESVPKFCVYYVRVPLMLATSAFLGRLAWTVEETELSQVSADATTVFLLTALWMGIFTFTKPLQQYAHMYTSSHTTRRFLATLKWFSWTSLALVWATFFTVVPLKMVYNRRWFDSVAMAVYSFTVLLWVVVAVNGWFLYPASIPLKVCK